MPLKSMAKVLSVLCLVDAQGSLTVETGVVPSSMQAFVAHSYVGTDFNKIKVETIDTPKIGDDEVLIQVAGSSVNPVDWKIIEKPAFPIKFPVTLGFDVAGTVVEVGSKCNRLKVGDKVWTDLGASMGAYAQYARAKETIVSLAPTNLPLEQSAVIPLVGLTGYEALVTYGRAPWSKTSNTTVLITAGQGGTGLVGIQMAKAWGATTVITACSTENIDLMKKLGADVIVDYTKESLWDVVPNDSVDVLYENLGQPGTADKGLDKVRSGGVYTYIAGSKPSKTKAGVEIDFFLTDSTDYKFLDAIKAVVEAGGLKPVIQKTYPLAQTAQAFVDESTKGIVGKLAISIA